MAASLAKRPKQERPFQDQVAIVTGGADGIGRSIVQMLVENGASVIIFDINDERMRETTQTLQEEGHRVVALNVNVAEEDSVEKAFQEFGKQFDRLDIMINCAGIVGPNGVKVEDVSVEDFDRVYGVNLRGSFIVTKYALKEMKKRNYGRILLFASIAGKEGNAGMSAYSTSKGGVIAFTKSVGKEYAETGITVNAIAPAVVRTKMVEGMDPAQVKYMTDKIPMKRCGTLEEVASITKFIVSQEASFNTGCCFDLTGGRAVY